MKWNWHSLLFGLLAAVAVYFQGQLSAGLIPIPADIAPFIVPVLVTLLTILTPRLREAAGENKPGG